jgi:hypothetical protein
MAGYLGNIPSAVPLTSADIADGIITSAKIVDGTIANADIANSTIDLTAKVTGTLPTSKGGTGIATIGSSLQVLRTNTGATALEFATVSGTTFGSALFHVRDEKSAGTNGGSGSTSFTKVTLNTVMTNEISGASISSDVITLPSGTYYINAIVTGLYCGMLKSKLRNTSDGTDTLIGSTVKPPDVGSDSLGSVDSFVIGRFTIASQKNFELQRRVDTAYTHSAGYAANYGVVEVYSQCQIWKVA